MAESITSWLKKQTALISLILVIVGGIAGGMAAYYSGKSTQTMMNERLEARMGIAEREIEKLKEQLSNGFKSIEEKIDINYKSQDARLHAIEISVAKIEQHLIDKKP